MSKWKQGAGVQKPFSSEGTKIELTGTACQCELCRYQSDKVYWLPEVSALTWKCENEECGHINILTDFVMPS